MKSVLWRQETTLMAEFKPKTDSLPDLWPQRQSGPRLSLLRISPRRPTVMLTDVMSEHITAD